MRWVFCVLRTLLGTSFKWMNKACSSQLGIPTWIILTPYMLSSGWTSGLGRPQPWEHKSRNQEHTALLPTASWHRKSCSRVMVLCLGSLVPEMNTKLQRGAPYLVQCVGARRRGRWALGRGLGVFVVVFPKPWETSLHELWKKGDISTLFLVQWVSLKASPENKRRKPVDRSLEWEREGRERNLRNGRLMRAGYSHWAMKDGRMDSRETTRISRQAGTRRSKLGEWDLKDALPEVFIEDSTYIII